MRTSRTVSILAATAAAAVLLAASPASAHVTIPGTATKGGFGIVTFSVPNEKDAASTTKIEVQLPKDVTLAFASAQPKPGWTVSTTKRELTTPVTTDDGSVTEVTDTVTWSGGSIGPGQFDTFSLSVGPLPTDKDELAFPAIQTYSDGTVVSWIDVASGSEEPEHPRPILHLVDAAAGADDHGTATTEATGDAVAAAPKDDDDSGNGLAVGALVVAIVALAVGGAGLAAGRRRPAA